MRLQFYGAVRGSSFNRYANGEFPDITTNEDTCPVQYFDDGILNPNPTCLSVFERGDTMSDGNGGTLRWEQAVDENDNPLFDDQGNIIYSGNLVYGVPNQHLTGQVALACPTAWF